MVLLANITTYTQDLMYFCMPAVYTLNGVAVSAPGYH